MTLNGLCMAVQPAQDDIETLQQIVTQAHRVAASGNIFQSLIVNRLEDDGGGCCSVAGLFI